MDFQKKNLIDFLNISLQTTTGQKTTGYSTQVNKLPKTYAGLDVKASVGMGTATAIPWITFTGYNQKTSNGIYPVLLFYKDKKILIVAFGVSATNEPAESWNLPGLKTLDQFFAEQKITLASIEKKYNGSFVHSVFPVPVVNNKVDESNFNIDNNSVNTFNSQSSLTNQNALKQKSLKQKDYKLIFYEKRFNKLSKYIYLLFFITLIIYLISLLVELDKKNNLNQGYNIYIQYRYLNRLYYNIFTALFSMICLSEKNSQKCTNYFIKYINNLLSIYNSDFKIFEFFYYENLIKINTFSSNLIL